MKVKREIRILGIDDAPFEKSRKERVLVIGTIFRGGEYLDGVLSTRIEPDGKDSTQRLVEMISQSKHKDQLRVIMIDGIALAGFNVVDVGKLYKETKIPIIVTIRKMPEFLKIKKALRRFDDYKERYAKIKRAGRVYSTKLRWGKIYFQVKGISREDAEEIIKKSSKHGIIPEPIRIAHLIASGVVLGESRGRA
jgi:hypothetical protein